jgi:hypothetical protein
MILFLGLQYFAINNFFFYKFFLLDISFKVSLNINNKAIKYNKIFLLGLLKKQKRRNIRLIIAVNINIYKRYI